MRKEGGEEQKEQMVGNRGLSNGDIKKILEWLTLINMSIFVTPRDIVTGTGIRPVRKENCRL